MSIRNGEEVSVFRTVIVAAVGTLAQAQRVKGQGRGQGKLL